MQKCCIITPYSSSHNKQDNTRRYRSMLAKLVYNEFQVYCYKDKEKGFLVFENKSRDFSKKTKYIAEEFNTNITFLDGNNIRVNLEDVIKSPQPTNGMGKWALASIANSKWEDLDLGENNDI